MEEKPAEPDSPGRFGNWTFIDRCRQSQPHQPLEDDVVVIDEEDNHHISSTETKANADDFPASAYGSREELCDEYYTSGDKIRSYIHKRNGKLSGTLNMILLGAIVTTACLAIGHVWGTTDDCSPEMSSSLSELLFAMQELQHENHVLRARIKTLEANEPNPIRDEETDRDYFLREDAAGRTTGCVCRDLEDIIRKDAEIDLAREERRAPKVSAGPPDDNFPQELMDLLQSQHTSEHFVQKRSAPNPETFAATINNNNSHGKHLIKNKKRQPDQSKRSPTEETLSNTKYNNDSYGKHQNKNKKRQQDESKRSLAEETTSDSKYGNDSYGKYQKNKKKWQQEEIKKKQPRDYQKIKYKDKNQKYQEKKRHENIDKIPRTFQDGHPQNRDRSRIDNDAYNAKKHHSNPKKQKHYQSDSESKRRKHKKYDSAE